MTCKKTLPFLLLFASISISINSYATTSYTDSTLFFNAINTYSTSILDFDTETAGSIINNGDTLSGITFNYAALQSFGVSMQIVDDFSTTSGSNYLGTNDGGMFQAGDGFNLSFNSVNAIGMFFISGEELENDDISLTVTNASGVTEALLSSVSEYTLSDGGFVYFLALLDDTNTFDSVEISSLDCGGCFLYNVDDITTSSISSVPVPAAFWLFLTGLVPLLRKVKA